MKGNAFVACSIICGKDVLNIWLKCGDISIILFNQHYSWYWGEEQEVLVKEQEGQCPQPQDLQGETNMTASEEETQEGCCSEHLVLSLICSLGLK